MRKKKAALHIQIITAALFALLYLAGLLITRDSDYVIFLLGYFGIIYYIAMIPAFLGGIFGWILAQVSATALSAFIGYLFGKVLEKITTATRSDS